ncbi:DUF2239 family protein [Azorhizobium sp. AG788]|uniref:DUF2239 family protein n=1 Tax=Azorhizobium sp. AG788 TaxID=2183897 RepID=UPI0031386AE5
MTPPANATFTVFQGFQRRAAGPLLEAALAVRAANAAGALETLLVFDDATGKVVDLDLRGTDADIAARLAPPGSDPASVEADLAPRPRGRPKLGVVAREITLLPRHWDWLAAQPGGASVVLRRLVDEARRAGASPQQARAAREAAYAFMSALAGNLPEFEEASRALFAADRAGLEARMAAWPQDVRAYALRLVDGPSASSETMGGPQ